MASHAERNAPFIQHFLTTIGGRPGEYPLRYPDDINAVPNNRSGLYLMFMRFIDDKGYSEGDIYPIYVGVTRRDYRKRFNEHKENGVIRKVWDKTFPRKQPKNMVLYAYTWDFAATTSKFLESVLLQNYNFCLNKDENDQTRKDLDYEQQFTPEESKGDFVIMWDNALGEILDADEAFKNHFKGNVTEAAATKI